MSPLKVFGAPTAIRGLPRELEWFREARFGMFVHFGLYALSGRNEWIMYNDKIPRAEYAKLTRRFNPRRFKAEEWVGVARAAGARYLTITAKHHDGFCLFDSALTDFKITNTPFGRDLIGELIHACQKTGLRIILYYSQPDWRHPNYVHRKGAFKDLQYDLPDDQPDWDKYMAYVFGQVEELCTKYGRIDGIWFDGCQRTERMWRGRELYRLIKKHQPAAVINDRAGYGDYFTPERSLSNLPAAAGYMVEACQSICRESWGYRRKGNLFSSPSLLDSLVRMIANDGNYLLNIGPKPDGSLPEDQVQRLLDIGRWLKQHAPAIYGVRGLPLRAESEDMLYTANGRKVYLHLLRRPVANAISLSRLKTHPVSAKLMGSPSALGIDGKNGCVRLTGLPSRPRHPCPQVIEMTFARADSVKPAPKPPPPTQHHVALRGPTVLDVTTATRTGFGLKGSVIELHKSDQAGAPCHYLSPWTHPCQKVTWYLCCKQPMRRRVTVRMASLPLHGGARFVVKVGRQVLHGVVPETKHHQDFQDVPLGTIRLPKGRSKLALAPIELALGYFFAHIQCVVLRN
ncbi:MAG: alpha-L-fucosidase [Verrucomicrobia bacterium]|nr:alpha-L-fucosidase [Verrucomicrobiota bacterium]